MHDLTKKYVGTKVKGYNPNLLFLHNEFNKYRIFCLPGGTRSGKTQSVVRLLWRYLHDYQGVTYSICRQTSPALKATVIRDFVDVGKEAKLYRENSHNLTDREYQINNNLVDYFSADSDEKVRGRSRNVLYLNEAPELDWHIVQQLMWRTTDKIIMDFNPSYPESWIYDKIMTRNDCAYITTTFLDNPFLSSGQVDEILWLKDNDPENYKIYGLGQRGELRGQIYKNWKRIKSLPEELPSIWVMDFGYTNDPSVISQFKVDGKQRAIYGRERLYMREQTNLDLVIHLFFAGADRNDMIIAECAEPKSIAEMRRGWAIEADYLQARAIQLGYDAAIKEKVLDKLHEAIKSGYMVQGSLKGADSILNGMQKVKQFEVFLTEDSTNAWKEYYKYRWAEDKKTGELLNLPVDDFNHFMDTIRYLALAEGRFF